MPLDNQILSMEAIISYCSINLANIIFVNLLKKELDQLKNKMEKRWKLASTIKGICSFHYFMYLSTSRLGMKWISLDDTFSLEVDLQQPEHTCLTLQHATAIQFLSAVYDEMWYIGMIKEADFLNSGFLLDFMNPNGLLSSFWWPEKCDIYWVPFQHILFMIEAPRLFSGSGQYQTMAAFARTVEIARLNCKC